MKGLVVTLLRSREEFYTTIEKVGGYRHWGTELNSN
jgi:hypothetical protein